MKKFWLLTPVFGTFIFLILYIISANLYPGGSQVNKNSIGFSWANNYWCNLMYKNAVNGKINPARPFALTGMVILCSTISFFWIVFPHKVKTNKIGKYIIQFSGSISMTFSLFLYTNQHDKMIITAGFFGVIALFGTFISLYKIKWYGLFSLGIINLLLLGLNNYVYHIEELIIYLPIIQKISFLTFLIWICIIDILLFYNNKIIDNTN